jgi:hypothetical protein
VTRASARHVALTGNALGAMAPWKPHGGEEPPHPAVGSRIAVLAPRRMGWARERITRMLNRK